MKKVLFLVAIASLSGMFILQGCAASSHSSKSETVTTQTTSGNQGVVYSGSDASAQQPAQSTVTETKTEVKEEKASSGGHVGIIGTTFHLIGVVLAFPFKVIAGVIEFIF